MALDAALRFTGAIKTGDELTLHVHHLTILIGAKACIRIMQAGRGPSGIERRFLDFMRRCRSFEIEIFA
jgi:hypothetical protein